LPKPLNPDNFVNVPNGVTLDHYDFNGLSKNPSLNGRTVATSVFVMKRKATGQIAPSLAYIENLAVVFQSVNKASAFPPTS
jgi:hypothetical protein